MLFRSHALERDPHEFDEVVAVQPMGDHDDDLLVRGSHGKVAVEDGRCVPHCDGVGSGGIVDVFHLLD